jgi:hypothetical protein
MGAKRDSLVGTMKPVPTLHSRPWVAETMINAENHRGSL